MSGNWAEREERLIKLPEDEPKVFEIYLNIVYTQLVPTATNVSATNVSTTKGDISDEYLSLTKVYVLGEKLQDKGVQNVAVDAILSLSMARDVDSKRWRPSAAAVGPKFDAVPICAGTV
jgi:hypothetical protein